MTDLPDGWKWSTIGEVASIQLGRQRSPKNHTGPHMRPYLRAANVTWNGISVDDVKEMNFDPDEAKTFELQEGDLLLNEASGSSNEVGKPAIWHGQIPGACFQNTLLRVRAETIQPKYLFWYCWYLARTGQFGEAGRGVSIRHLGKRGLSTFPAPVPARDEQDRIVAAIEQHLSGLDAADASLHAARSRSGQLQRSALAHAVAGFPERLLGDLAVGANYGTSTKCSYGGGGPPVVRIPNVQAGRLDLSDLKHAVDKSAVASSAFLESGDVLFIRSNGSLGLVGRAAVVEPEGKLAFASYLIRFRLSDDLVPAYLALVSSAPRVRHQIERLAASSAGQHNLSLAKLNALRVPCPGRDEQLRIVEAHESLRDALADATREIVTAERRTSALRRSILAAAFSGRLVPS